MANTTSFRDQHERALAVAGQISAQLNPSTLRADAGDVRRLLSQLVGSIKIHLAMEDQSLYPELAGCGDPKVSAVARRFQQEMGGIKGAFEAYVGKWPSAAAIQQNPEAFIADTKNILGALARRIEKENKELYPLADALVRS